MSTVILFKVADPEDVQEHEVERIVDELGPYVLGEGPFPPSAIEVGIEDFMAVGRVEDCDCQLIQCACSEARRHAEGCRHRLALTCAVGIACEEHGRDVCSSCDACDCGGRA